MFFFVFVLVVASIIYGLWLLYRREDRSRRQLLDGLRAQNFSSEHLLEGGSHYVAFDSNSHRVAFATAKGVQLFHFDEMAEIQWFWIDRNGRKESNFLHFRMNNVVCPLIKVRCTSAQQAEHWNAKVQAIWALPT